MEFGDWEVDDDVWNATAEVGEVQESMPMRRAHLAASRDTAVDNLSGAIDGDAAGADDEDDMPGTHTHTHAWAVGPFQSRCSCLLMPPTASTT